MQVSQKAYARFGLDPSKLEIDVLLKNRCYRRLYNIVANDQTYSISMFRPNLIKQLYFLLQITPFIEESLQDSFLGNIEEWYNSNDHKKIQLSKNLQKKVGNIKGKQNKQTNQKPGRPKTGVQWDSSLNPFLRPYTAKLRKGEQFKEQKQGFQSTNANTNQIESLNQNENGMLKNVIDIQQEWERSQDFNKKYRTLHPEEEPTYEKLLNLIERVSLIDSEKNSHHKQKNKQNPKRKIQSAMINREKTRQAAEEEIACMKKQKEEDDDNLDVNNLGEEIEEEQQNLVQTDKALEEQEIQFDGLKCFTKDKRTKNGSNANRIYTRINGLRIVRPFTGKQTNIIEKLATYSNLHKNHNIRSNNEDKQFAAHYQNYIRKKTVLKKQLSRKSESIRILQSAKKTRIRSNFTEEIKQGQTKIQDKENIQMIPKNKVNEIIVKGPLKTQQQKLQQIDEKLITHYNENKFFRRVSSANIKSAYKGINKLEDTEIVTGQPSLTKNMRFNSELKFDPLNPLSRDQYNEQILSDIQKIKSKLGGKFNISSDTLTKALYVDMPVSPCKFQVPDKTFMMLSNGEKKKKKKKLRKQTKNKTKERL